jgi:hypothetical protein
MRAKITTGVALAVALCAIGAFAAPAFAKEKIAFGEFEGSITGQNLETTPGVLKVNTVEGFTEITGLEIGPYTFGPKNPTTGEQETEEPCKSIKLSGEVKKEKSSELTFQLKFNKCPAWAEAGALQEEVPTSFKLGVTLKSNFSAEVGKSESALEIEPGEVKFKGALKKCPVIIPRQTIPSKLNPEKEYEEIVEYENESFEPEGIEHSKHLKELYPSGEKETLNVEFLERFHHIKAYVAQGGRCTNVKGIENGKVVTEEGPYKGMLEFPAGHMFGEIDDIEIKNGNLKFKE